MKQVTIVVPEGNTNLSSITGSFEILSRANAYWEAAENEPLMNIRIAGFVTDIKLDAGFVTVHPVDIRNIEKTDLLIIPSVCYDNNVMEDNEALIGWIRDQYTGGAEVASMCTGIFLLAATGLLDGKACSTHWDFAADFRRMFPNVRLKTDKLITSEGGIHTNGGGYSFLNLLLFLVENHFGREIAILCSKVFQIDIERSSQSPFHIFRMQKNHGDEVISQAQAYIEENLQEKISFEKLAFDLATSRRNFDRRFIKATGNTPVEYLQRVKVEVAKRALEKGRKSIFDVMDEVGYSDEKAFREVFRKITGMSPLNYRAKYNRGGLRA